MRNTAKKDRVKASKAHRRKGGSVKTHTRKTSKPFRIHWYTRKHRRTKAQIAAAKARKKKK